MRQHGDLLLSPPERGIATKAQFLNFLEHRRLNGELGSFFQIVATISTFEEKDELLRKLEASKFRIVNSYGNFHSLEAIMKEDDDKTERIIPYYLFTDETRGINLFLTRATKTDEMPETILSFIDTTRDISNFWIPPIMMHHLKEELDSKFNDEFQMNYFTAIRNASTKRSAEMRPNYNRTFQYTGMDAKSTLGELEIRYGVFPKIMEVRIGAKARFRIDDKGIVTLREGDSSLAFSTLDYLIEKSLPVSKEVLSSKYEKRTIEGIERWIQHPFSISMPSGLNQEIEFELLEEISNDYWKFIPIVPYVEEDTPYLSSRFVDGAKSSTFDVEMTKKLSRVYPVDRMDIGVALRFYHFVSNHIDVGAMVGIV